MTLDEAIKNMETIAKGHQLAIDTGIIFNDTPIDMLFRDNTEAKNERIANYKRLAEEHRQLAVWLTELKQLREQTEWITVSKRLPERYKEVIVTDVETSDTYLSRYIGNEYWECDNGPFKNRIIAWQPKPKPYKEEENER